MAVRNQLLVMAHARHISTQTIVELCNDWRITLTPLNACADPAGLAAFGDSLLIGSAPGTVLAAAEKAGSDVLKHKSPDDFDVWYERYFDAESTAPSELAFLVFEGLATIADVWLNGEHLLRSENMYLRHEIDVTAALQSHNQLVIRFASLNSFLEQRRPRPRWRTKLVDHQQLRWVRTTLIGRMPGWHEWAHCIHAVGPWRPISLITERQIRLESSDIRASVEGETGVVQASLTLRSLAGTISEATLVASEYTAPLQVTRSANDYRLTGEVRIPNAALWWPHTHGEQPLHFVRVTLIIDGMPTEIDFGRTGFRAISVSTKDGGFAVSINDEPVFMRGANWTAADTANLAADEFTYDRLLGMARDCGMNMIRVPGNGFYESDAFYDRCAELGITIWQDFSFGLMDYPTENAPFFASVTEEAGQLLDRLQFNPALTVLCGNSECEAAAAMHGLTASQWSNPLFEEILPQISRQICPDVPYIPSSQWGGALPFHVNQGVSHYYGVGAYLRPLDDLRRSGVRFAAECLGLSNIPENETIDSFLAEGESPGHHPSWNAGVPRNVGLGWDFGDVRDHYTRLLLGEDPGAARFSDSERFLAQGRLVNDELMTAAYAEWRRPGSTCRGALIWFFRDLWPCAGWGLIDSENRPKSVYYALKRILSPLAVFFEDEGLSGLRVHVINENPFAIEATLRIALYRHGQACVCEQSVPIFVPARGHSEWSVDEQIGHFADTSYAYRFGPPAQDVVVAALDAVTDGLTPARAFHFPAGLRYSKSADLGLKAQAFCSGDGKYQLLVRAERFAQAVQIETRGYRADDNYFHLEPGSERAVTLTPVSPAGKTFSGSVTAFNALLPARICFSTEGMP